MPTDPLDDRIRSMMSDAMSSAPAAPSLSLRAPVRATPPRRGLLWAGIGIAACIAAVAALVWTSDDDDHVVVSASTTTPVTEPSVPWPAGVAAIVGSSRGIERVSSENGQAVVTRVLDGVGVARAIQLEDGGIVFQEMGGDIRYMAPDGSVSETALVTDDGTGSTVLHDADSPNGELRLVYSVPTTDPASSFDLGVWFQPDEPRYTLPPGGFGVGYRRFTIIDDHSVVAATVDDTGQRSSFTVTYRNGIAETATGPYDSPVALAGDGAGSVGWVTEDGRFTTTGVRSGSQPGVAAGLDVTELDWRGQWLMVTRDGGLAGTLVDLVTEQRYDVPTSGGVVTLSRYAVPSTEPTPTTVPTSVAPTTVLPVSWPNVVTAGLNGVWEYGPDGDVQWTTEPMAFAVKAPDGTMLMQRQSGGYPGAGWTQADTLPLRQASPGAPLVDLFESLFPAADLVPGWYTLHDAATVDGRPLVILDRQASVSNGIDTPAGALLVLDLDARSLDQIDQFGGWESASSRLHLAATGLVVGETYTEAVRSFYSVRLDGAPAMSAADLGLEADYVDCTDCPRLYTISRDGSTIAWLEGTHIERRSMFGDDFGMPPVELGGITGGPLEATDLSISADVAVYDRNFIGNSSTPIVVYLDGDTARSVELPPASRTALP